jgi:hypothetical protein
MKVKPTSKPGGTSPTSTRRGTNMVAGGQGSKVVRPTGTRDGSKAYPVNPGAVAQLGGSYGDHITDRPGTNYRGEPWTVGKPPISVPLGNELAKNVGKGGPGAGREVMRCGSQTGVSPVRSPNATGKDILNEFGPNSKR